MKKVVRIIDGSEARDFYPAAEVDAIMEAAREVNEWLKRTNREGTAHQIHLEKVLAGENVEHCATHTFCYQSKNMPTHFTCGCKI